MSLVVELYKKGLKMLHLLLRVMDPQVHPYSLIGYEITQAEGSRGLYRVAAGRNLPIKDSLVYIRGENPDTYYFVDGLGVQEGIQVEHGMRLIPGEIKLRLRHAYECMLASAEPRFVSAAGVVLLLPHVPAAQEVPAD